MTTADLRETFLLTDLFHPGQIDLAYVDLDRTVIGSAVPLDSPLQLLTCDELKAAYFTERRELGILNIGGPGIVTVNGESFDLANLDALYVGRGNEDISFASRDSNSPAEFYLLSYPAHAAHPTARIQSAHEPRVKLGAAQTANDREITKLSHRAGVRSCQWVMGFTQLASGSVWNTMPPHTHMRRSEVYLYFRHSSRSSRSAPVWVRRMRRAASSSPTSRSPSRPAGRFRARRRHCQLCFLLGHGRREPGLRRHGQARDRRASLAACANRIPQYPAWREP